MAAQTDLHHARGHHHPALLDQARAVFFAGTVKPWDFAAGWLAEAYEMHRKGMVPAWRGDTGRCLILGYGETVWSEAFEAGTRFDAVIASPEAAQHRDAPGWVWGNVTAIGRTDEHCVRLARIMGFGPDQVVFCGRQAEQVAA